MTKEPLSYAEFENLIGMENINLYKDSVIQAIEDERKISEFNIGLEPFIPFDATTKAMVIHNKICGRLEHVFKGINNVQTDRWKRIFAVKFDDKILIRNKKFKEKGLISSAGTKQHLKFIKQTLQLVPELLEQPHFIIGGYLLDKTATQLIGVFFAYHTANGVEWFTNVGKYVSEQKRFEFPDISPEKSIEKVKRRAKAKKQGGDNAKTANDN